MAPARPANGATAAGGNGIDSLIPDGTDLLYEEELLRNPYSLKMWIRYIDANKAAPLPKRRLLFERALQKLPGSYKVRGSEGCVGQWRPCRAGTRGGRGSAWARWAGVWEAQVGDRI